MSYAAYPLLAVLLLVYATWVFFLGCVAVYNAWKEKKISKPIVVFALPMLAIMVALDFVLNIVASFVFLELPWNKMQNGKRAWLLTLRCDYHISGGGDAWQQKLAVLICSKLLDPFEIGGHCHRV